jgi:hypothetical protein
VPNVTWDWTQSSAVRSQNPICTKSILTFIHTVSLLLYKYTVDSDENVIQKQIPKFHVASLVTRTYCTAIYCAVNVDETEHQDTKLSTISLLCRRYNILLRVSRYKQLDVVGVEFAWVRAGLTTAFCSSWAAGLVFGAEEWFAWEHSYTLHQ